MNYSQLVEELKKVCDFEVTSKHVGDDIAKLADIFQGFGDYYYEAKDFIKSAAFYNLALTLQKQEIGITDCKNLERKIILVDSSFQKQLALPDYNSQYVSPLENILTKKAKLAEIRKNIKAKLNDTNIQTIYDSIASEITQFIQNLIKECKQVLGEPPCKYAIIGLGSLARKEATPYSDLEFAILIAKEKEDYKIYFRNLTKLLHLKIINLGETIIPALNIKEINEHFFDCFTPRGFAFDGAMPQACKTPLGKPGVYELIHTPNEMAKFQFIKIDDPDQRYWFQIEEHLPVILSNIRLIEGDESLIIRYKNKVVKFLNKSYGGVRLREYQAKELLKKDLEEFFPQVGAEELEGQSFEAKRDLYRMPQIFIDRLALWFGLEKESSWERIGELLERGILTEKGAENLKWLINKTLELRLRTYLTYGAQRESIDPLLKRFNLKETNQVLHKMSLDKEDLEEVKRIIKVLIAMHTAMKAFLKGDLSLLRSDLEDKSDFAAGQISARLCQYLDAKKYYSNAYQNNSNNILVVHSLAKLLNANGDTDEAIKLLNNVIDNQKEYLSSSEQVQLLNQLGLAYHKQGFLDKAYEYFEQALNSIPKIEADKNGHFAASFNNLGLVYFDKGNYVKAVEHYKKAKQYAQDYYGKDHPVVCIVENNLAAVYLRQGEFKFTLIYYKHIYLVHTKLYGLTHPKVAEDLINLAAYYQEMGCFRQAVAKTEEALNIFKKIYGKNHLLVGNALHNLSSYKNELGNFKEARNLAKKALDILDKIYGGSHAQLAILLCNLACIEYELNLFGEANKHFQESVAIFERLPQGDRHIMILLRSNFAKALQKAGQFDKAAQLYISAFTEYEQIAEVRPDWQLFYNNRGAYYARLGRIEEAVKDFKKSLEISKEFYGALHFTVGRTKNNLGHVLYEKGLYDQAENYLQDSIEIHEKSFGKKHISIGLNLSNLGHCYHAQGKYKEALHYYEQAFKIITKFYRNINRYPEEANCYNDLGSYYASIKNKKKAKEYYEKALSIQQRCFDGIHLDIAITYNNIALTYNKVNLKEAKRYLNEAYTIVTNFYKQPHPIIIKILLNLSNTSRLLGNLSEATKMHEQASALLAQIHYPINHNLHILCNHHKSLLEFDKANYHHAKQYSKKAYLVKQPVGSPQEHKIIGQSLLKCHQNLTIRKFHRDNYINEGHHYFALRYYQKAFKAYTTALELNDVNDEYINKKLFYRLAFSAYHLRNFGQAYALIDKALGIGKPTVPELELKEKIKLVTVHDSNYNSLAEIRIIRNRL